MYKNLADMAEKKGVEGEKTKTQPIVAPVDNFSFLLKEITKYKDELKEGVISNEIQKIINNRLKEIIENSKLETTYKIIFLFHEHDSDIDNSTLDSIYTAVKSNKEKNTLLLLSSSGGYIGPAYLISKACKEYSKDLFSVAIPRRAKSAATLITLGADRVHMGSISELGPIDPQIRKLPALALGEAVEYLAEISEKYPNSADMFSRFLAQELDLQALGHTKRIADSAIQYAVRLLGNKKLPKPAQKIGERLVKEYKDHGFVIDRDEAKTILGNEIILFDTDEYKLADEIYKFLEEVKLALWAVKSGDYRYNLIGECDRLWLVKRD